jgi:hypothetical protein
LLPLHDVKYNKRGVADSKQTASLPLDYMKSVFSDSTALFKLLAKPGKGMLKKLKAGLHANLSLINL